MPSTSNTSPATPAAHPDIPPFPSPSTFSILPDIWLLIARLNILHQQPHQNQQQQATQAQTNGQNGLSNHQQSQQQPPSSSSSSQQGHPTSQNPLSTTPSQLSQVPQQQQQHHQHQHQQHAPSTGTGTGTGPSATFHGAPLLDLKDLPAQIYPLKQRLAKARAAVSGLPDVDRTVAEQEDEIRRLQGMVRGLRARLGLLGELAARGGEKDGAGDGDVEMKDDGGEERRQDEGEEDG